MLSFAELRLLTACVDGELTPRQRRQAARLLRRSPEARQLLAELRGDSSELQALPVEPAPPALSDSIIAAIAKLPPSRSSRKTEPARPPAPAVPLWLAYASAAAVLLAVGAASFFLHHGDDSASPGSKGGLAKKEQRPAPDDRPRPDEGSRLAKKGPDPAPTVPETPSVRIVPGDEPDEPEESMPAPPVKPERPRDPVLASGGDESSGVLERVELALPKVHILHGLHVPEQAKALQAQLAGGAAGFRLELPARDATRGLERVRAVLAALRTPLVLDANVQARLKKPAWRTDYAVFLENVHPADLAEMLRQVGAADRAAGSKKAADLCFDGPLVAKELMRWDRRDLLDLFGLDPAKVRPASKTPPLDIRKPLEETTGKQVDEVLDGRGTPRPGSTVRLPGYGIAQVLGLRGRTPELQRFLATRQPPRPGTLQVLLVLRQVAG